MDRIKDAPAVTIRQPATANLMVDSADRTETIYPSPWKFIINRPNSILNGYFNRIATTEVVLEWGQPNIVGNEEFTVSYNGSPDFTYNPPRGFYTAEALLEDLVVGLNAHFGAGTFAIANPFPGTAVISVAANTFVVTETNLSSRIGFPPADYGNPIAAFATTDVDIRYTRYIDFVSSQLTYNQDLKDSSTAEIVRDVLCRWYFAWDSPPPLDNYGFPIYMSYQPFVLRRLFSPPKQIRWDMIQPVGQLNFEVFDDLGQELAYDPTGQYNSNWLMTLQVSEN